MYTRTISTMPVLLAALFILTVTPSLSSADCTSSLAFCDEDALFASDISSCENATDPLCTIDDIIIRCPSSCGSQGCTFDFPNSQGLKLKGTGGFCAENGVPLTVKARFIFDEGSASDIRFEGTPTSEAQGQIALEGTLSQNDWNANKPVDISLSGKVVNSTGPIAGAIWIQGHNVTLGELNASTTSTGSNDAGSVTVTATSRDITITDRIFTKGRGSGGDVTLKAARNVSISTGEGIIAQKVSSNSGSPGNVTILSEGDLLENGDPPTIDIQRKVLANATGGSTDGGAVFVGTTDPNSYPEIVLDANVKTDSQGTGFDGGPVSLVGNKVRVDGGEILANGTGAGGKGGTVKIIGMLEDPDNNEKVVWLSKVTSKGRTGGKIIVRGDGEIIGKNLLHAMANSGPGTGGEICVTSVDQPVGCDPNDPCDQSTCDPEPLCLQEVDFENHVRAHGFGSSGIGGKITVEGAEVRMPDSPIGLKEINADGNGSTGGSAAGNILLRSADPNDPGKVGQIKLFRDDPDTGDDHTVTSRKSATTGNPVRTSDSAVGGIILPSHSTKDESGVDIPFVPCR